MGSPHLEYLRLNHTTQQRSKYYRSLFKHQVSDQDLMLIRKAAHYCQPVGDDRFRVSIEKQYGIKAGQMSRGWPVSEK